MRITPHFVLIVLLLAYLAFGVGELVLSYMFGMNREVLGMAFLFPAIATVVAARKVNVLQAPHLSYIGIDLRLSFSMWLVVVTSAVLVYSTTIADYHLSPAFLLLVSAAALIIVYQIFQSAISSARAYLILGEVIATGLLLTYAFQFQFPGPIGNDSTYHLGMVDAILNTGHTWDYPGQYVYYPIYQILLAQIGMITSASAKISMAILGLAEIPFLLTVFLTADRIFDRRAALTATLLAAFAPHILQAWYMYFPNCFTVLFFALGIFLALRHPTSGAMKALLVLVFLVILVTHPLAPAILLLFMFLLLLGAKLVVKAPLNITAGTFALFAVATVVRWTTSGSEGTSQLGLLLNSLKSILSNEVGSSLSGVTMSASFPLLDVVLYDLGLALLILVSAWGGLYILQRVRGAGRDLPLMDVKRAVLLAATMLCTIPVPYVLAAVYPDSQPDRWFPFIETLMCLVAGFSVALFFRSGKRTGRVVLGAVVAFLLVFMMMTSPQANVTNNVYSSSMSDRYALTLSEENGREFITAQSLPELHASSGYYEFINRTLVNIKDYYDPTYERYILNPNDPLTYSDGSVAVRQYDLDHGFSIALYGREGKLVEINYANDQFNATLAGMNNVYSNPSVKIYTTG